MQISEINQKELTSVSKKINQVNPEVFYFADSLGSLDPSRVKTIIQTIRVNWKRCLQWCQSI